MSDHTLWQQGRLPGDILMLIFEELYRTAPASLRTVRLASRRLDILVIPIVYRHVRLNEKLVNSFKKNETSCFPEKADARKRVRKAICAFTRQITIDRPLNWPLVVDMLASMEQLHHMTFWKSRGPPSRAQRRIRIPQEIFVCLADRWPSAKLSLDTPSKESPFITGEIDCVTTNLVSLKLHDVFWQFDDGLERTLEPFLLRCDRLKVLHINQARVGARYLDEDIKKGRRLPAVEELFLNSYPWLHSPRIATSFWNWSRLTSLRLEEVFIINFIESVSPANLIRLRSLITDGHCENAADRTKATNLMARLVRAINGLEALSLVCSVEMFPIDSIRKHGPSLRKLQLREYTGIEHQPLRQSRVPTPSLHALLEIHSFCPNLMELALDLDQGAMVCKSFATSPIWRLIKSLQSCSLTSVLMACRNLRRLTMFVQQPFLSGNDLDNGRDLCRCFGKGPHDTCMGEKCQAYHIIEVGAASNFVERTYEAICTFFEDLVIRKSGAVFELLTMHVAGNRDEVSPDVVFKDDQRQQFIVNSRQRTFVYEPEKIDGLPEFLFKKELVHETKAR